MNNRCQNSKVYQTEIYWENSAIRTFPASYGYDVPEETRVISLNELEKQRFQEVQLRREFKTTKSDKSFRSLATILLGSIMTGFVGCSEEAIDQTMQDVAPASQVEFSEPAPAAASFGNGDLRVKSGRSLPLPPAMEYGS